MTTSTVFPQVESDGSGHPVKRARGDRDVQAYRLIDPNFEQGIACMSCGNAGDVHGDPRRGWCLLWRHMVSGRGTCASFNAVRWTERITIKNAPADPASKTPTRAAAGQHLVPDDGLRGHHGIGGSNPPGCASSQSAAQGCESGNSVRDTSRASYAALKASGALSRQQLQVMAAFDRWPYRTFTRWELAKEVGLEINAVTGRIAELLEAGAVIETGKRICRIKGHEVYELRVAV